ncbi:alpha-ketoacid dehydrogenase subunit beta [Nocardioides sp. GXZ039]|uniref:alpha-ketoacid dehydrogenase subunit beta n=1 Tax=Nocardioides sp. GXZ039 TaxID=3136018 RepID=UPI0030F3A15B
MTQQTTEARTPRTTKKLRYQQAIGLAIEEEMRRDERVFAMGQDLTSLGGQFGLSRGLIDSFTENRVRDTGVVETFMIGAACGAALGGAVPVVDITFSDFMFIAGDEIFNKLAKWRFMHGGTPNELPVTVIAGTGVLGGSGAEHNSSLEAHLLHNPGLKVAVPSTPADVKGLLKSAIRDPDPVIFMPNKGLFFTRGEVPLDDDFTIPLGVASTPRQGDAATIITYSGSVPLVLDAADQLAADGIDVEVIDLRTIVPLDWDAVLSSVERTGRAMVVHEAVTTGGVGAEIAARLQAELFGRLEAPVLRVCGKDTHIPQNAHLEKYCLPSVEEILAGARALVSTERPVPQPVG